MSIFQCQNCGCAENTSLCNYHSTKTFPEWFDWTNIEDRRGKALCSACSPTKYADGEKTENGEWHGKFKRKFLPKGQFYTDSSGSLRHRITDMTMQEWQDWSDAQSPKIFECKGHPKKHSKKELTAMFDTLNKIHNEEEVDK